MIGETVSHYKILEQIGKGGMGVVYKALDTTLDRHVALKFLPHHLTADTLAKQRFVREAKAASALEHANIGVIHEIDEASDGRLFIVMPCYEGETLGEKIARGPLDVSEALDIAIQIASGLTKAHEKGIIHRDIKPDNIMVTTEGQVKVMDFGLAKRVDGTRLTQSGMTVGTLSYMSPEQSRGLESDQRTDIWSLGAVLYEMLTGKAPFTAEHEAALMYSIVNVDPDPVTSVRPEIPLEVERLVEHALEKDRDRRYATAGQFLDEMRELRRCLDALPRRGRTQLKLIRYRTQIGLGVSLLVVIATAVVLGIRFFAQPARAIESIAVLPFDNLSNDPDQDWFVDGMADELIGQLGKIGALTVISRTSSMHYKDKKMSLREIARELNADAIVEGSVLRTGDQVRISASLVRANPERQLWTDSYVRDVANVLELHSEVARTIASEVHVTLTPDEQTRLAGVGAVNTAAYDAFLKGRASLGERTEKGVLQAIEHFESAIQIDSTYALAHAGLAEAYVLIAFWGFVPMDPSEAYPKAERAALAAVRFDETLADAYTSLALVKIGLWNWDGVEAGLSRAIELNPSHAVARFWYSQLLLFLGRFDEAVEQINIAAELDPRSLDIKVCQGWIWYGAGEYDRAIQHYRAALEIDPDYYLGHFSLAFTYLQKGDYEASILEYQRSAEIDTAAFDPVAGLAMVYALDNQPEKADEVLETLLRRKEVEKHIPAFHLAAIYGNRGEKDEAFAWLERAYHDQEAWLANLKFDPVLKSLRSDPRFRAMCRKVGLEPGSMAYSRDRVYIAYDVRGQGQPAIVFIHGYCCNRSYWDAQVEYFASRYTVVTVDLAGHGESGYDPNDWSIGALGSDVVAVVEKLGLESVILVGNSLGGSVMLEAALKMPQRTIGLVSVDGLLDPATRFAIDEELAVMRADFVGSTERDLRQNTFRANADPVLVQTIVDDITACPRDMAIALTKESLAYYNSGGVKRALESIDVPIRAIHSMYPIEAYTFAPYTSMIEWVNLEGIGHFPMMEDPERFNPLLAEMIGEIVDLSTSE